MFLFIFLLVLCQNNSNSQSHIYHSKPTRKGLFLCGCSVLHGPLRTPTEHRYVYNIIVKDTYLCLKKIRYPSILTPAGKNFIMVYDLEKKSFILISPFTIRQIHLLNEFYTTIWVSSVGSWILFSSRTNENPIEQNV